MKSLKIIVVTLTMSASGLALGSESLERIASCSEVGGEGILDVSRSVTDHAQGVVEYGSLDNVQIPALDAEIAYTNAGARAVITSPNNEFPLLVIVGTGRSELKWEGKKWVCETRF